MRDTHEPQVIVTVTLNAALGVSYEAHGVTWDGVNQVTGVRYRAAGRGVAVARVLHTFGHEVIAAGLAGGSAGEMIRADLARSGIPAEFTPIGRESRRVLEVRDSANGHRLAFSEPGPYITTEELGRFAADYRRWLAGATAVVLCGSLPAGMPPEIYGSLASWAAEAGVPAILDAGGPALRYGAGAGRHPALVIPDPHDLRGVGGAAGEGWPPPGLAPGVPGVGGAAGEGRPLPGPAPGVPGVGGAAGGGPAAPGSAPAVPGDLDPRLLVAGGAGAVALVSAREVRVVTAGGQWRARLPASDGPGWPRDALVAGLVPGVLLGWSWPDRLRHAVALGASSSADGEVDLEAYERLVGAVIVDQPDALAAEAGT
jgi:tagatose 6-phosphate kinase